MSLSFVRSKFSSGEASDVIIVGLDSPFEKVKSIKEHYLYDERILLPIREESVRNVMVLGIKQPITVTPSEDGQHFLVVDGRQRVRWLREANRRLAEAGQKGLPLPIVLEQPKDEATGIAIGASLNAHRLADSVLAKAEKAIGMRNRGQTPDDVAIALGVSESSAKNFINLGKADNKVKEALREGKISPAQAYELARQTKAEQKASLEDIINNPISQKEKLVDVVGNAIARAVRAGVSSAALERAISFGKEQGEQRVAEDKAREVKRKASEQRKAKAAAKAEKRAALAAAKASKVAEEELSAPEEMPTEA